MIKGIIVRTGYWYCRDSIVRDQMAGIFTPADCALPDCPLCRHIDLHYLVPIPKV